MEQETFSTTKGSYFRGQCQSERAIETHLASGVSSYWRLSGGGGPHPALFGPVFVGKLVTYYDVVCGPVSNAV